MNFFYKVWSEATKGENDFKVINLDYSMNPNYTKEGWYENMCNTLGNDKDVIDRELHGKFIEKEKPASQRVNLRIKSELYEKMINKIKGRNISDYIRELIEKDLRENE